MSDMAKFEKTYCSQCGGEFGPGDHGYSHCADHPLNVESLQRSARLLPVEYQTRMSYEYSEVDGLFHVYSNNQTVCMSEDSGVANAICRIFNALLTTGRR